MKRSQMSSSFVVVMVLATTYSVPALVAAAVSHTDIVLTVKMLRNVRLTFARIPIPEPQNPKTLEPQTPHRKTLNSKPHPKPRGTRRPESCGEREWLDGMPSFQVLVMVCFGLAAGLSVGFGDYTRFWLLVLELWMLGCADTLLRS